MPKNEDERPENSEDAQRLEMPDAPAGVKVSLDPPDDDDDRDDGDKTPSDRPGQETRTRNEDGTWAKKKADRAKGHREEKAWQKEKSDYEARIRRMQEDNDRQIRDLRADVDRLRQQPGGQQAADPYEAKLADIEAQLKHELKLIEKDDSHGYERYNQLRRQEQRVLMEQVLAQRDAASRNQPQQGRDPYAARGPIIEAEYPWTSDQRFAPLAKKAWTYRQYLIDVMQRPDTIDTDREALAFIQANHGGEFGLAPPPAPASQRTRSMYAAPPSRGTPDRGSRPREMVLPPELANGTGLSPQRLSRAVREAIGDE